MAAQSGVTAVAAGEHHTVALNGDGSVLAWGLNDAGQTTVPVESQSGVMANAAGGWQTVALKINGTVLAWGYNEWGQTKVPAGLSQVMAIAAGYNMMIIEKNQPKEADSSCLPAFGWLDLRV